MCVVTGCDGWGQAERVYASVHTAALDEKRERVWVVVRCGWVCYCNMRRGLGEGGIVYFSLGECLSGFWLACECSGSISVALAFLSQAITRATFQQPPTQPALL